MTDENEKKTASFSIDLWWMIQVYFVISLIICILEMYHGAVGLGAVELIAAGLTYAGPANFVSALRSRRESKHGIPMLALLAVFAGATVAAAIWLMRWSDFHMTLFGVRFEGVHWVIIGAVIALIAGRKENE